MSKCAKCGKELADGWKACPYCGATVETVCAYCGKTLDPAWVTCPFCGKPVKKEEPKTQTQKPAKPEKFVFEFSEDTAGLSEAFDKQLKAQEEAKTPAKPAVPDGILSKEEAKKLYKQEKYKQALPSLLYYAEQGDTDFWYDVGYCYDDCKGVKRDYVKAAFWYSKAAEKGDARAQHNLGLLYEFGQGVGEDYEKAFYWYSKAADQGYSYACFSIACFYNLGHGVAKDINKAIYWYEKAAEKGHQVAKLNLGEYYEKGNGVAKDINKAIYWYEKAAAQGGFFAEDALARLKKLKK